MLYLSREYIAGGIAVIARGKVPRFPFTGTGRLKMACRRVAVGQRSRLQGAMTPSWKRMSYHGILLPANKEEPSGYKKSEVPAFPRGKNSPFCPARELPYLATLDVSSTYHRIAFPPFSTFFHRRSPRRVSLSTSDLKKERSSCIRGAKGCKGTRSTT